MDQPVTATVVSQYAEEAAFLWTLRDAAVRSPHYLIADLVRLDSRIEAHLDGLRIAGEAGRDVVRAAFAETGEAGEAFAAAVSAQESGDQGQIDEILAALGADPGTARGVISALGWSPYEQVSPLIKRIAAAESPALRRIGIAAAAVHRKSPGRNALQEGFASIDNRLKARALRAAGELGLVDMAHPIRANLKAKDPTCRFWAGWTTALLNGHPDAVAYLQNVAEAGGRFAERAARMAMRRLQGKEARLWLRRLVKDLRQVRIALVAAGALGDPDTVLFLIDQMKVPAMARVAGESLCLITGGHIANDTLEGEKPEGFDPGPTENPEDEDVAMDRDENLLWPDPALVQKWWNSRQNHFTKGTRYLLGQPITPESLRQALKTGFQRQRAAAALELAIIEPGRPLFEVRAPGLRQRELLGRG